MTDDGPQSDDSTYIYKYMQEDALDYKCKVQGF